MEVVHRISQHGVGAVDGVTVRLVNELLLLLGEGSGPGPERAARHHRIDAQDMCSCLDDEVRRPGRLVVELQDDMTLEERN